MSVLSAFAASSIDDFVLRVALYGDRHADLREITCAKLFSTAIVLGATVAVAVACQVMPPSLSRAAGFVPLALGIKWLMERRVPRIEIAPLKTATSAHIHIGRPTQRVARHAVGFFAASLDNIALYIPLFARSSRIAIALAIGIIFVLNLLLCGITMLPGQMRIRIPCPVTRLRFDAVIPYLMLYIGIKALAASLD
jgi:cadmium resistance protein CadD (predicted permease)